MCPSRPTKSRGRRTAAASPSSSTATSSGCSTRRTGAAYGALAIIDPDGFPSSRIARGVTFSANGAAITFDDCPRSHSGCKPGMVAIKP